MVKTAVKAKKHNKIGQLMRSKGLTTRRRIIDQTMLLLRDRPAVEVSAADIARSSGLTPPGLYLYFESVSDIVIAKLQEVKLIRPRFMDLLQRPWRESTLFEQALDFVHSYVEFWTFHESALRYRNLMSDEGDERFRRLRVEMSRPVVETLLERIKQGVHGGELPESLEAAAAAAAALGLVDHAAAVANAPYGDWGSVPWDREAYLRSVAYMLTSVIRG